tara:strand:+ start:4222 stop:4482 length:261 start_codon:yes stop_codon:yes gene_type:complete
MNYSEQTVRESKEIILIFKKKVLQQFKTEKWQEKISQEISELLNDYKTRERFRVGKQIANQYEGFIPMPKSSFYNRIRFLFTGHIS